MVYFLRPLKLVARLLEGSRHPVWEALETPGVGDEAGQRLQTWVKTQRDNVGRIVKMTKGVSESKVIHLTTENSRFLPRFGWIYLSRDIKSIGTPSVVGLVSKLSFLSSS